MANLRDIKRSARLRLHETMKVAALYISAPGQTPIPITVRVHTKWNAPEMQGADGGAVRRDVKAKLLFIIDEMVEKGIKLKRKDIISVEPGEAYELDNADVPDLISVTFFVTPLNAEKAAGLPVPGDELDTEDPSESEVDG